MVNISVEQLKTKSLILLLFEFDILIVRKCMHKNAVDMKTFKPNLLTIHDRNSYRGNKCYKSLIKSVSIASLSISG